MLPVLLVCLAPTASLQAAPAPDLVFDRPAAPLLAALNENTRAVRSLVCKLDVDVKQNRSAIGFSGKLAWGPNGLFRLQGNVLGRPAVDVGSSDAAAWLTISSAGPLISHKISRRGTDATSARWPLPFSPDWLGEILVVARRGRPGEYRLERHGDTLRLVEQATGPSGQPVRKVTLIRQTGTKVEVMGHRLEDAKGKLLCTVTVVKVQHDTATGAILPSQLHLECPSEAVSVKVWLSGFRVNVPLDPGLFNLPQVAK
jgi:hypothetical protein